MSPTLISANYPQLRASNQFIMLALPSPPPTLLSQLQLERFFIPDSSHYSWPGAIRKELRCAFSQFVPLWSFPYSSLLKSWPFTLYVGLFYSVLDFLLHSSFLCFVRLSTFSEFIPLGSFLYPSRLKSWPFTLYVGLFYFVLGFLLHSSFNYIVRLLAKTTYV